MSSFTPPTQRKDYRLDNYRTCSICAENVNCGIDGMISHMQANHSLEELATEISFKWQPNEAKAFHHPNGTVHFYQTGGSDLITTVCGRDIQRQSTAPDESREEWFDRVNYEHAAADDYCGNCVNLYEYKYSGNSLPDPLTN